MDTKEDAIKKFREVIEMENNKDTEIQPYKSYREYKAELAAELTKTAESFVRIGYLLKVARDTRVLEESGYKTVTEFAQAEYGLTKDVVSRYIDINDRYSEGGYSEKLQERYQKFGYSKLAEMLTLPTAVAEVIAPETTRAQIQEIKREIREEEKITDIEVMMEQAAGTQEGMDSELEKFLDQYCHENREAYPWLWDAVNKTAYAESSDPVIERIMDVLAPSGIGTMMCRVPGIGKLMLSIQGKDKEPELVNIRANEKTVHTWEEIISILERICPAEPGKDAREEWEERYQETWEMKKPEVAPVQQKKEEERVKGREVKTEHKGIKTDAQTEKENAALGETETERERCNPGNAGEVDPGKGEDSGQDAEEPEALAEDRGLEQETQNGEGPEVVEDKEAGKIKEEWKAAMLEACMQITQKDWEKAYLETIKAAGLAERWRHLGETGQIPGQQELKDWENGRYMPGKETEDEN